MINKKLKRIAIILSIVSFSIAGVISCSGEDITGSGFSGAVIGNDGENGGNIKPDENGSGGNTNIGGDTNSATNFPYDSYLNVYVTPWINWSKRRPNTPLGGSAGFYKVSWQDTNTLTELWKESIQGENFNDDKKIWAIKDVNIGKDANSYYYFDDNFDIVHVYEKETAAGKYGHGVKVKQFLGGVIVRYSGGEANPTTWSIGGLYKTLLNKDKNNSQGKIGYTKYKYDNNLKDFMRAEHNREEGDLSIIFMNVGYDNHKEPREFGVDEQYCSTDNNYRKNPDYFLGKDPESYSGTINYVNNNYVWKNEKLNIRVNHWNNFRFFRL